MRATRFPTLLTAVYRRPGPSVTCVNTVRATGGVRSRTGVNEPKTEPMGRSSGSGAFTRFRVLRTTVHHRPLTFVSWAYAQRVVAGERSLTGVNETKTEPRPRPRPAGCGTENLPGVAR
jgi:hypothetical protein